MPRATTAACDVMPPCEVTTPWAWIRPWMSSGVVSQRTSTTASPAAPRVAAVSASNTAAPTAAPGEAPRPRAMGSTATEESRRGCRRCSSCAGSIRITASSGVITPSATNSRTILQRGLRGALGRARLEHVELALLDRELDVLHLAVVALEALDRGDELVVGVGHQLVHARDRLGRADAGDDVLALRVLEELAVQRVLAGRGVAAEADAGAGALAAVAEHHLADVGGRPEVVGDVVRAAVDVRARRSPRAEHRRDREPQLLARLLREVVPAALAVEPLELGAEPAQVVAREIGVELRALLGLAPRERALEDVRRDARDDVAEHLQEPAVGVVREARIARLLGQRRGGDVVQAEVQDRLHHARHRDGRAAAHRHEQRGRRVAEAAAAALLERRQSRVDLLLQALGPVAAGVHRVHAGGGRDREAVGHGQPEPRHLGEPGALAAEQLFRHLRRIGEGVDVGVAHAVRASTSSMARIAASSTARFETSSTGQPSRRCSALASSSSSWMRLSSA